MDVNDNFFNHLEINCGVSQGLLLGPLLFLVYVNDMSVEIDSKLLLYADDWVLIMSDKNLGEIEEKLSRELMKVSENLFDDKLSIHLEKTEPILFGTYRT